MQIVLTGAGGALGAMLVPRLVARGIALVLAGPDTAALARRFPALPVRPEADLGPKARGADLLLCLGDGAGSGVPPGLLAQARAAGITRILYTRPLGAPAPDDAAEGVETLTLPPVHDDSASGPLARLAFTVRAAVRPTLGAARLADHIAAGTTGGILSDGQAKNRVYHGAKRIFDLTFAIAVIGLFWWGLLAIWAAIRLSSPGPGIFRQDRVGRGGRVFTCYKFRTMAQGTRQAGTHDVSAAAVTRLGRILRATKLDELPQVLNILKNEISLIGPRPCLPLQEDLVNERRTRGVLAIKPGISGLAQTEGIDMSDPERLARRDADYVALQSLSLDLRLVLATALGGGQGDKVRS